MKCFNCSSPITGSEKFCGRCGAAQGFSPALIRRAAAGDQAALTELYNKTYENVYHTVKALIRDEDAALDIMQDSYLKAFRNLNTLNEAEKFRAWIKRIAHNNAVDYLRRTKPVMFSAMPTDENGAEVEFEDTNTANLPEVVIDRQETARLMAQILDTLPDDQRMVISMFYYEGMSVKEIAAELGVTENTVKSRLNYARKKIEVQVLDLEKKGTKLYGLAPIPFLMLLFRNWGSSTPQIPASVPQTILSSSARPASYTPAQQAAAARQVTRTASQTAYRPAPPQYAVPYAPAAQTAAVGTVIAAKKGVGVKILAVILSVVILGSAAVGVMYLTHTGPFADGGIFSGEPKYDGTPYTDPSGTWTVNLPDDWSKEVEIKEINPNELGGVDVYFLYHDSIILCIYTVSSKFDTIVSLGGSMLGDKLESTSDYTVYKYDCRNSMFIQKPTFDNAEDEKVYNTLVDELDQVLETYRLN